MWQAGSWFVLEYIEGKEQEVKRTVNGKGLGRGKEIEHVFYSLLI